MMIDHSASSIWDAGASEYDAGTRRNGYFNFVSSWVTEHARDLDGLRECHVLDMGCGTGLNIRQLSGARSQIRAEGVDFSPSMIEVARATKMYERLHVHDLDTPIPAIPSESFDLAIAFGFMEFLRDAYTCVSECCRGLKANGILWATFQRYEAGDCGSPPREMAVGTLRIRGYSAGEILHMANDVGMRVIGMDAKIGYVTQNGFGCPYYVLRAQKAPSDKSKT